MMVIENVVIEKELYGKLEITNPITVTWAFMARSNPEMIIGECIVKDDKDNSQYVADITLYETGKVSKPRGLGTKVRVSDTVCRLLRLNKSLYPAIGGISSSDGTYTLSEVGISHIKNTDSTIPPIKYNG